jgi:hypothetical protein
MITVITVIKFFVAWLVGWFAAFILLLAYENECPKCQDPQLEKQIKEAFRKLCFRSGLIVAVIWLMYHLTPAFGD